MNLKRLLALALVALLVLLVYKAIPDVRRYLQIRRM